MLLSIVIPGRRSDVSVWGRVAAVTAVVSILAYGLQIALDHIPAPHAFKFVEFWVVLGGTAVLGCLAGMIAVFQGYRSARWNATVACGLLGIGWLVLVQAIQLAWN